MITPGEKNLLDQVRRGLAPGQEIESFRRTADGGIEMHFSPPPALGRRYFTSPTADEATICLSCDQRFDRYGNGHAQGCLEAPAGRLTYIPDPTKIPPLPTSIISFRDDSEDLEHTMRVHALSWLICGIVIGFVLGAVAATVWPK